MKPLYCFILDEKTGKITRHIIEKYQEYHPSAFVPTRLIYSFKDGYYRHDLNARNIDKCVNWRYYTFEDNMDKAKEAFTFELRMKIIKAKQDYLRYSNAYEKILGGLSGDEENRDILSI